MTASISLLLFAIGLFATCYADKQPYPFPKTFTISYEEEMNLQPIAIKIYMYSDPAHKRALSYLVDEEKSVFKAFFFIYSPPDAQPGTPAADGYALIYIPPAPPSEGKCWYATTPFFTTGPFPLSWTTGSYGNMDDPLVVFPDDLIYVGQVLDDEIVSDKWISKRNSTIKRNNIGTVPTFSYFVDAISQFPHKVIDAHESRNTFDPEYYFVRKFTSFSLNLPPAEVFLPPAGWLFACNNQNNGFVEIPSHGHVCTPTGNDNFTLNLAAPPVDALGPVHVYFVSSGNVDYNCTDCVSLEPTQPLVFDGKNWNQPIRVDLVFRNYGRSIYAIRANGGGYDNTGGQYIAVTACDGIPGWSCDRAAIEEGKFV
jgi:hypothetical protein